MGADEELYWCLLVETSRPHSGGSGCKERGRRLVMSHSPESVAYEGLAALKDVRPVNSCSANATGTQPVCRKIAAETVERLTSRCTRVQISNM